MKKQLLLLVMLMLPLVASADDSGSCGANVTYTYTESTKTLVISGIGDMDNFTWNYSTDSPNSPWYSYRTDILTVIIENGVTSIGNWAFYGCSGLTSVTIPNSVTTIEWGAFNKCSGLTSVTIPNSVTSICSYAFCDCSGLISVTIPYSVTSIGHNAFWKCSGLTSVTIPNSVTSISNWAFCDCSGLTSLIIGNSVTSIGNCAFAGCSGLTSVTIPNSVTSIGEYAFERCSGLTSVIIGNSVTFIGEDAFNNCSGLTDVYCHAVNVPNTETYAFYFSNINNATLHVPQGCVEKYRAVAPWSNFKSIVEIDGSSIVEPVELTLTAQEENGLVRLRHNSILNALSYRITRTDANGVESLFYEEGHCYPSNMEYVDAPPAAGTYTYFVKCPYLDANGERQVAKSNSVTATITQPQDEETAATEYGTVTGNIVCDKNPPVSGLKVNFSSDDITAHVQGTNFMRQGIPVGTNLTMTVTGDDGHDYESANITVNPGVNTVTINGIQKENYEPGKDKYDLRHYYYTEVEVIGGVYHIRFSVENIGDYPWEGYVYVTAKQKVNKYFKWLMKEKPTYTGQFYIERLDKYGKCNVDIALEGIELDEETKFELNFRSEGKWLTGNANDEYVIKELEIYEEYRDLGFPIIKEFPQTSQTSDDWNSMAQEDFSYLMLGLCSVTPGMKDGVFAEDLSLSPYSNTMIKFAKEYSGKTTVSEALNYIFEWMSGKTALETINEYNFYNLSSTSKSVITELKNIVLPESSILQKFRKDVIMTTSKIKDATNMMHNIVSLANAVKGDDAFEVILDCSSIIYTLAADKTVPLASIMYTYQVAGKTLIEAAKRFQPVLAEAYLSERLRNNYWYHGERTGENANRRNTAVDFKLVVKNEKDGRVIDFTNGLAKGQITDIRVIGQNRPGIDKKVTFYPILHYENDGIMLDFLSSNSSEARKYASNLDVATPLTKFYLEIHWENNRLTVIPLDKGYDGIDIDYGNASNSYDHFEDYKPLTFTITLTTKTGIENMSDELYLGSNKKRQ